MTHKGSWAAPWGPLPAQGYLSLSPCICCIGRAHWSCLTCPCRRALWSSSRRDGSVPVLQDPAWHSDAYQPCGLQCQIKQDRAATWRKNWQTVRGWRCSRRSPWAALARSSAPPLLWRSCRAALRSWLAERWVPGLGKHLKGMEMWPKDAGQLSQTQPLLFLCPDGNGQCCHCCHWTVAPARLEQFNFPLNKGTERLGFPQPRKAKFCSSKWFLKYFWDFYDFIPFENMKAGVIILNNTVLQVDESKWQSSFLMEFDFFF